MAEQEYKPLTVQPCVACAGSGKTLLSNECCDVCLGECEVNVCPHCSNAAPINDYDVLGAEWGNVFCNKCGKEVAQ